ncbi:alpha/beta hydrolase [Thermobifida alba]|uniref:Alpha/beta hydrolase n=1 Tax=Thermobifida alba TaxID=53522 RepID=A0ABY4KZ44_THEAE|nr:alpha/beta hydrolase [Thermobifida alba]UPT20489.1 alpha/beta hydrolase [Thermobifida alba]HLU95919.1 alpha/beta hydrolase [Thermobifida alba]
MNLGIDAPDRLATTALPDGRRLGWAQWGRDDARPVLFFSGSAMGRSLGFGTHLLTERNLRLIAVERPGVGASDPLPGRTLTDWTHDVRNLAAALHLSGFTIVGFSHGALFALACAAAGIGEAVAVVSGTDDLAHPDLAALLDAAATDRAVYTSPGFASAYRACLAEGLARGAAGYARDLVLAFTPWPFDPAHTTVPVDLWYGAHDNTTVHSPDLGATLAIRIPEARRHLVADAGGSLLWTHAGRILDSLLSASC